MPFLAGGVFTRAKRFEKRPAKFEKAMSLSSHVDVEYNVGRLSLLVLAVFRNSVLVPSRHNFLVEHLL